MFRRINHLSDRSKGNIWFYEFWLWREIAVRDIKPYISDSYSLPSTSSFMDKIKELTPTNDTKLVSFNVTSVFTNIPVDVVIDNIANKLFSCNVVRELPVLQSMKPITQSIFKKIADSDTVSTYQVSSV